MTGEAVNRMSVRLDTLMLAQSGREFVCGLSGTLIMRVRILECNLAEITAWSRLENY